MTIKEYFVVPHRHNEFWHISNNSSIINSSKSQNLKLVFAIDISKNFNMK